MNTKKKDADARSSLLLALLASPLGWLADSSPVALRDRRPHGDSADSLAAQVSATLWSLALLAVAVVAPSWWAAPAVAGVLLLVLPTRTAAGRGGELVVPTRADRGARGRMPVTAWALGLMPAPSYAAIDRRESDPEGVRGRRTRRIRAVLLVVLPVSLLALDTHTRGALSTQVAPLWGVQVVMPGGLTVPIDAGVLGRVLAALVVIATLSASTSALGRYHSEDLALTGTQRFPGMAARLAAALGVTVQAFDLDSELHWNDPRPRHRGAGFHARTISGPVAKALTKAENREAVGQLFPEWELTSWDHSSFRLAPVTAAERARRSNLADLEGLAESVAGDGEGGTEGGEPVRLDTDDVDWED